MKLEVWHNILRMHFTTLSESRRSEDRKVFAIEHGLTRDQVEGLSNDVREAVRKCKWNSNAWLPWVVYATEIGYNFSGEEYWQTFTEETPHFEPEDRSFIKDCFNKFVSEFNGFEPTGRWASHFNIISLPITHSILPKDYQLDLAKIVYQLGQYLTPSLIKDPEILGRRIHDHSLRESRRFQRFTDNHELVGLIVRELLTHDTLGGEGALEENAFQRIVRNLNDTKQAREWLAEAKTRARRTSVEGEQVTLSPNLRFIPGDHNNWFVEIEIPDLESLARQSEEYRTFLNSSRATLLGSTNNKRIPKGCLTGFGVHRTRLSVLPEDGKSLLEFQRELPTKLERVLKSDLSLSLGQGNHLVAVLPDGSAELCSSKRLLSDSEYMIATRGEISDLKSISKLDCEISGLNLYSIDQQEVAFGILKKELEDLGFIIDNGYRLSPIGLPPVNWDGDLRFEYLEGDSPILAVSSDFEFDSLRLTLEPFDQIEIKGPVKAKDLVMVSLPELSGGLFGLKVERKPNLNEEFEEVLKANLLVRERGTSLQRSTNKNAFFVLTDPPEATLEDLISGNVSFEFLGPSTSISVSLSDATDIHGDKGDWGLEIVTDCELPGNASRLNELITGAFENPSRIESLAKFVSIRLEFVSEDYGTSVQTFRREFVPIEWEARKVNGNIEINLTDIANNFNDQLFSIHRYPLLSPDRCEVLDADHDLPVQINSENGGLYLASIGTRSKGLIVIGASAHGRMADLGDFESSQDLAITLKKYERGLDSIEELIKLHNYWYDAQQVVSAMDKWKARSVLREIRKKIADLIMKPRLAGFDRTFENLESLNQAFRAESKIKDQIRKALTSVDFEHHSADEIVEVFARVCQELLGDTYVERRRNQIIIRKMMGSKFLAEFVLRLCEAPGTLQEWCRFQDKFQKGLVTMMKRQELVGAARYVVLRTQLVNGYRWNWE